MKNTFLNMVLVLGGITLVSSAAVGLVYRLTAAPIALAQQAGAKTALGGVLPDFDRSGSETVRVDGMDIVVHTASKRGSVVGYAVETLTRRGFSGDIRMMVGFTPDGRVNSVEVLEHAETPGFGDKIKNADNPLFVSFRGRNPSEMRLSVTNDGGEVDILTGATITSRAYVDAVARAFNALMTVTGGAGVDSPAPVDGSTGATETDGTSGATKTADASTGATKSADASTGATKTADASTGTTKNADASTGATGVAKTGGKEAADE